MGDISTWNPVDNSNTTAPPDGWPEGMAPSGVNNSARAMMGAVRRWYDTVTAQLASITTALGNYVPLAGGTMTGALQAPIMTVNGVNAAFNFNDQNGTSPYWAWHANGGTAFLYTNGANRVAVDGTGGIAAASLTSTGLIATPGTLSGGFIHSTGNVQADNAVTAPAMTATGTIQAAQLTSTGNINAAGNLTGSFVYSTGNMQADGTFTGSGAVIGGTVTAGYVHSAGNVQADNAVTATGTIQGAQLTSTGNINAAGTVTGTTFIGTVSVPANGPISTGGLITGGQIHSTGNMYVDGPLSVAAPCLNLDGAWQIISDARMKTGIADYKPGLEAILALRPCAYRYLPELFGSEEAEKTRYGLVADEVAPVLPEMVGETVFGGRHLSTLNPGHVSLLLVNACRELAAQNAALAARITALEGNHHAI